MKNRFLFVFMLLLFSVGAAVAQTPKHWTLPNHPGTWDALNMTATMVINVDGVELSNSNIEMAAFIGETLMSEGELPIVQSSGRYLYFMTLNGFATPANANRHNRLTFKLYDHSTDTELEYMTPVEIIYSTNWVLGSTSNPFVVSFFTNEDELAWTKVNASDLKSGDVVVMGSADSDYIMSRERGSVGGVYDVEKDGNTITFSEPTSAANWYKKAPQKFVIYKDAVANSNNAVALFANSGYLRTPEVDPEDELDYNEFDLWPTLNITSSIPELNAYWSVAIDGGDANITAIGDNPYSTVQFEPDEELFACFAEASAEGLCLYRLGVPGDEPQPETYTVELTVEPADAGTVVIAPEQDEYEAGTMVTLAATPAEGYEFVNFTVNGEPIEMPYAVNGNVEIVANFQLQSFDVTVVANPSYVATVNGSNTYTYGQQITPTYGLYNPGYYFVNWTVNGEVIELPYTVTEAVEIVANFVQYEYEVTVSVSDEAAGTAELVEEGPFHLGDAVNVNATANEGYEFVNFTVNGEEVEMPLTVTGNVEIVANFQALTFEVTAEVNPAESGTVAGAGTYNYGETVTLTATPAEGYQFSYFSIEGQDNIETNPYEFTITENVQVVAFFELLPPDEFMVSVTVNPEGAGTVEGAGLYTEGTEVTLVATANEGYEFVNFTMNGEVVEMPIVVNANVEIVANFNQIEYNVTVVADEAAGTAEIVEEAPYYYGAEINVIATPNAGYEFVNFTVNGEEVAMPYTVNGDVEIVANFTQLEYTLVVNVEPVEGGEVSVSLDGPYHFGDEVTLTVAPAEGYDFSNWLVGEEEYEGETLTLTIEDNMEVTAIFDMHFYEISVEANPVEGGDVDILDGDTNLGAELTIVATPNEGWAFVNWMLGEEVVSTEAEYTFQVAGDADFVANFEMIEYNIAVEAGEGGEATITDGPYHFGDEVTVTATPNDGYNFLNWTVNGEEVSTALAYTFTVAEDLTLVANFAEAIIPMYTITAVANPAEGGTVAGAGTVLEGTEVVLTATAAMGYTFVNWTFGEEVVGEEAEYSFEATAETAGEYVANFAQIEYNVTVEATEGGTAMIVDAPEVYHYGDVIELAYEAEDGYQFVNFTVNGEEITSPYTVVGDVVIMANFELIPVTPEYMVTVVVNPAEAGTVTGAGLYEEGTEITLEATANDGYEFINFTIEGEEVEMPYTVTADVEIVANFELIPVIPEYMVTVVVNPAEAGTVTGAGLYEEGTEITLEATANDGYEFINFTIEGEEVEMPYTVTADVEIVANFELIPVIPEYMVTVVVNPAEAGTVTGAGLYEEGTEITLEATANDGYEFVNFTIEGEEVEMPYTVVADVEIVANFNLIPVVPTYNITVEEVEHGFLSAPATAEADELITVSVTAEPMYSLVALHYTIDGSNEIVDIDLNTKQFVMPAADITIGGVFELVEGHGDVNLDGYINVVDIVAVFNYILDKDPQPFDFAQADMNEDGVVDISDAMAINALILGLKAECGDTEVTYQIKDGQLFIDSEVALAGYQFRLSAEPASINVAGFSTMGNWSNGEYILVVYNLGGEQEAGIYSVLDMGDANLNSIVMATKEGCRVRGTEGIVSVASFDENKYSVYPVPANTQVTVAGPEMTSIEVFNMMGQKVMTVNANSAETVVNVSMLTAGNYLFRINTVNGVTVKNVVVVR